MYSSRSSATLHHHLQQQQLPAGGGQSPNQRNLAGQEDDSLTLLQQLTSSTPHHLQQQQQHQPRQQQHQQHHQTLLHHHTLQHHPIQLNQSQLTNSMNHYHNEHQLTATPNSQQSILHHQHQQLQLQLQQQHQKQQQQQQQYNMNSDYSSSTYHIYDQISDLIIIKQQRMERKRQLEHRRKVILMALGAALIIGTLIVLTYQTLQASYSNASTGGNSYNSNNLQNAIPAITPSPSMVVQMPPQVPSNDFFTDWKIRPIQPIWTPPADDRHKLQVFKASDILQFPVQQQMPPISSNPELQLQQAILSTTTSTTSTTTTTPAPMISDPPTSQQDSSYQQPDTFQAHASPSGSIDAAFPHLFPPHPKGSFAQNSAMMDQQTPNMLVERQCDDGVDNDQDGLIDCADSECCSDKVCYNSTLCMKSPNPVDTLMKKQPTPPTASFFQRMQFLIEKFSSQIYSNPKDFNNSRASVIRGRVTYMKQGLIGVRISVASQINLGMTLSREGGYFDLMVNGGGTVVIEFRREPFVVHQKAVRVPWNEIILMDTVELTIDNLPLSSDGQTSGSSGSSGASFGSGSSEAAPVCLSHNYQFLRPQIVPVPRPSRKSTSSSKLLQASVPKAVILRDSAIVQQSIPLPGSHFVQSDYSAGGSQVPESSSQRDNQSVSLVYVSSRANEFMSTINIQMIPTSEQFKLPTELKQVSLKIVIEGNLFEQSFEPQNNLSFVFGWNRRNVYRQKCFGLSNALISVGYEYFDCKKVVWTTKQIQLPGHDLSISDIDQQWNLNIHHRYNYRDSILLRGDGQNFNLKSDKPKIISPLMGDGYSRPATCPNCDGATTLTEQRLSKPQALVSAPDGSLYVGDSNMIRKIEWSSQASAGASSSRQATISPPAFGSQSSSLSNSGEHLVRTILELPVNRVPSRYSLALNLADNNKLYMTDIDRHQIYLIRDVDKSAQVASGQPFAANDPAAVDANSQGSSGGPSSLAQANWDDNLLPIVGNGLKCQVNDRLNCGDGQSARFARLIEPKAIEFDLSGKMYIADGPTVRFVDLDQKIYTLLGSYGMQRHTIFPCSGEAIPLHKFSPKSPQDLAVNPIDDTLYILDDNVVYKITQDKRVQKVAGHLAHCGLPDLASRQRQQHTLKASEIYLQSAQSINFNQNGDLFISEDDQKQTIARVLLVSPEDDTVKLYAGLTIDSATITSLSNSKKQTSELQQYLQYLVWTESQLSNSSMIEGSNFNQPQQDQRASNYLSSSVGTQAPTRALDYKFNSISAICVDQLGKLVVADKVQLRLLFVEPDLPQINPSGEYELASPENGNEILVFNRHGHHIATREVSSSQSRSSSNKYTFTYSVNTSFGLLTSVLYESGNRIVIHRDGPHHVKTIETAFGGQCKLDTRVGQVHSITITAPSSSKTNFSYHVDGGLLKQSRDQASGEVFDFTYDEFGRALSIQQASPKFSSPLVCRLGPQASQQAQTPVQRHFQQLLLQRQPYQSPLCSNLIVSS